MNWFIILARTPQFSEKENSPVFWERYFNLSSFCQEKSWCVCMCVWWNRNQEIFICRFNGELKLWELKLKSSLDWLQAASMGFPGELESTGPQDSISLWHLLVSDEAMFWHSVCWTFSQDSYEACRNLVPVEKVVYNVLDHLEKLFGWSFLCILFNRTNLNAYPGLREIHESLQTGNSFSYLHFAVKFCL